mmetsp:Transcript_10042/g.14722  ORF Transcript_10042/g.14722 Transcript_10042/m.14722 type:complete len:324 (-) Transcript_10042:91-1062(-)|eukprot:CAMPEP_0197256812 /NCGR_PEP_ID=MMETSP1429-20130617/76665_1 /TAXON_ID=49237 /ORGANISM="Chaetoceros  sp., Strain UNC1202" /LENGTH=323 /DNA_ID=CAMNT_0042720481 /DNA_START=121 /DNA_END=1092 /DNA_ORIENTATION=-
MSLFKHTRTIVKSTAKNGNGNLRYLSRQSFRNVYTPPSSSRMYHALASRDEDGKNDQESSLTFDARQVSLEHRSYSTFASQVQARNLITSPNLNTAILQSKRHNSTLSDQGNNAKANITSNEETQTSKDGTSPTVRKEKIQSAARKGSTVVKKGANSMREIVQKYGWTFVGTYISIYVVTLGSLFGALDSGLIDPITITQIHFPWHTGGAEDAASAASADKDEFDSSVEFVSSYMKKFAWTAPYSDIMLRNPHMTNLAIAWVATKLTEPIRLAAALGILKLNAKKGPGEDVAENMDGDRDEHVQGEERDSDGESKDKEKVTPS